MGPLSVLIFTISCKAIGANDPIVSDSARIFVGNQGPTVAAQGFVARPGIYEFQRGTRHIR